MNKKFLIAALAGATLIGAAVMPTLNAEENAPELMVDYDPATSVGIQKDGEMPVTVTIESDGQEVVGYADYGDGPVLLTDEEIQMEEDFSSGREAVSSSLDGDEETIFIGQN